MNLSAPFILRPVMTTLVMSAVLLFGVMSYRQLPVSDLPSVDFPAITVSASLPGASPQTMASAVATVLEGEFATIPGLDAMSSVSALGSTQVTLQFSLGRDIDAAAQDVQTAISRTLRRLPPTMTTPPSFNKVNPADAPFLYLALTAPTLPLPALNDYGETMIGQRLSMVDGVAQVQVFGAQKRAVRVRLDPRELASRGLALEDVAAAVDKGNANLPTGVVNGRFRALTVQADGQLMRAGEYRPLVVTWRAGAPVRLEDLGRVEDGVENDLTAAWYCTPAARERAIVLAVQRQPGRNTVEVAAAVKKVLAGLEGRLPPAVQMNLLFDRSQTIKESFLDVRATLLLSLVLVVLVIFVFLRNVSATVIPGLALPMSLAGTFIVMSVLGYSLDNVSLMALTLAIGFVVDDAIVMLENIVRHREMGKPRLQAALDGSREVSFTIVSMTVSLSAVFIPVLFMGGIVGRIFREFAVTIGAAVLVSGVVSLTLTPMLCSRFLRASAGAHHGRVHALSERAFQALSSFYDRTLRAALAMPGTMLAMSLVVLVLTGYLFWRIPKGFLPVEDRGQVMLSTEAREGTSFEAMAALQEQLAAIVAADPNVDSFMSRVGSRIGGGGGSNTGGMFIRLKPRDRRPLGAEAFVQQLRPKLAAVPGIQAFAQIPDAIPTGARSSKSKYQYTLTGQDLDGLYRGAALLMGRLAAAPGLQDVTSDMQLKNPELAVAVDRDLAASLGLSMSQVEATLYAAYGARQVSTIYAPDSQYAVILELDRAFQADPGQLSLLHVRNSRGQLVPLSACARLREEAGPLTIAHAGQIPAVTISFNVRPGVAVGDAVAAVEAQAREVLPDGVTGAFQGAALVFQDTLRGMGLLLLLAVVVIYLVLGVLYEDFLHPLTILSALPFAGAGALVTLMAFDQDLSLYAYVGIIMLIGLVKKNGIMMVDFAIVRRREGRSAADAIHEACLVRFRPIMMTTMAAMVAAVPIAVGWGAGGESRKPLGLAVAGGLLLSQTLTLYVTPVFYLWMERLAARLRRRTAVEAAA